MVRPNTGRGATVTREALNDKYRIASVAEVEPIWSAVFDATCDACMHVATQGAALQAIAADMGAASCGMRR